MLGQIRSLERETAHIKGQQQLLVRSSVNPGSDVHQPAAFQRTVQPQPPEQGAQQQWTQRRIQEQAVLQQPNATVELKIAASADGQVPAAAARPQAITPEATGQSTAPATLQLPPAENRPVARDQATHTSTKNTAPVAAAVPVPEGFAQHFFIRFVVAVTVNQRLPSHHYFRPLALQRLLLLRLFGALQPLPGIGWRPSKCYLPRARKNGL